MLPPANHYVGSLPADCDVEDRKIGSNSVFVATVNGVEGVVHWDGQKAAEQQRQLSRMVRATERRCLLKRVEGTAIPERA